MLDVANIDKDIELNSTFDIGGLVRQLRLSNYLMPMFEAIVNSIQSIYLSKIKEGYIEVYIVILNKQKLTSRIIVSIECKKLKAS